jgi:hypothetical protein
LYVALGSRGGDVVNYIRFTVFFLFLMSSIAGAEPSKRVKDLNSWILGTLKMDTGGLEIMDARLDCPSPSNDYSYKFELLVQNQDQAPGVYQILISDNSREQTRSVQLSGNGLRTCDYVVKEKFHNFYFIDSNSITYEILTRPDNPNCGGHIGGVLEFHPEPTRRLQFLPVMELINYSCNRNPEWSKDMAQPLKASAR